MGQLAKKHEVYDLGMISVEEEVKNLLEMFEFYLTERSLGRPVELLGEIVVDLRVIISRLLTEHFLKLHPDREANFCATLAELLTERAENLPLYSSDDDQYIDYVVGEILTAFEWAQEVKAEFKGDMVMQRIVVLDIPILRPFDYSVRDQMRVVAGASHQRHPVQRRRH